MRVIRRAALDRRVTGRRADRAIVQTAEGTEIKPRRPSGFYWEYGEDGPDFSPINEVETLAAPGFSIRWGIAKNVFESDLAVTMRPIRAAVRVPGEPQPVSYLSFDLFHARRGHALEPDDFVECCDTHSQAIFDLAYALSKSGFAVADYLKHGPLLHFAGLEVRPPFNGKQAGVRFARRLIARLVRKYRVSAILMKPFPMQFEGSGSAIDGEGRTLEEARQKLAFYYQRTLRCAPLGPGSEIYYLPIGAQARR